MIEKDYVPSVKKDKKFQNEIIINNNYVYLKVENFENDYTERMSRISVENRKIIIDFRGNMGGRVSYANAFLKIFVDTSAPVYFVKNRNLGERAIYFRNSKGDFRNKEIYIFVNEFTASSAELSTAVLKEHCHATIIGERTYGKGVMLQCIQVSSERDILVPVYEFYTSNIKIHETGLYPDIEACRSQIDSWISYYCS